jgi:hypothetical protein
MTPEVIQLAVMVLQAAIKAEPIIAAGIHDLLSKNDPTPEDWERLRQHTKGLPAFKLPE